MQGVSIPMDLYTDLIEKEAKLAQLIGLYDGAEECGVECSQLRETHRLVMARIEAIKRNFAPPQADRLNRIET